MAIHTFVLRLSFPFPLSDGFFLSPKLPEGREIKNNSKTNTGNQMYGTCPLENLQTVLKFALQKLLPLSTDCE